MKTIKQILESVNDEKEEWFKKRTARHIDLVKKYCRRIYEYDPKRFPTILEQGEKHDASKYKLPERNPYIDISWHYHLKSQGKKYEVSPEKEKEMHFASEHHLKTNPHHPEFHSSAISGMVNKDIDDRQKKTRLFDASKMPDKEIAEMVADWSAVSEEVHDTPKQWADKMIGHRWKFTDKQVKLINELIEAIWH